MSKCSHWEKIKKLNLSLLHCHSVDLDYTAQKIIHTLRQRTPAKLSGNAEFLCTAARAQSNIKDILSRNIPYIHNGPTAQSPALMPAGRSWQAQGGVDSGPVAVAGMIVSILDPMGSLQQQKQCLCFCIQRCAYIICRQLEQNTNCVEMKMREMTLSHFSLCGRYFLSSVKQLRLISLTRTLQINNLPSHFYLLFGK